MLEIYWKEDYANCAHSRIPNIGEIWQLFTGCRGLTGRLQCFELMFAVFFIPDMLQYHSRVANNVLCRQTEQKLQRPTW